jgi:hypothetical protein
LLEIIMRRYERASTLLTSNRPVEDWGKLLGDTAAVAAFLDRLLHHARPDLRPAELAYPASERAERGMSRAPGLGERPSRSRIDDLGSIHCWACPKTGPAPRSLKPGPRPVDFASAIVASALLRAVAPMG